MIWIKANYLHIKSILKYMDTIKQLHPSLPSFFYNQKTGFARWPSKCTIYLHYIITSANLKKINGIIVAESHGAIHVHLDGNPNSYNMDKVTKSILHYTQPFFIFAKKETLNIFANRLYYANKHYSIEYYVMVRDYNQSLQKITHSKSTAFKKSRVIDYIDLRDLEEAYQKEEVIIGSSDKENLTKILDIFKNKLAQGHTYHLEHNKEVVSKASFNSLSFFYDVLGGVFTKQNKRGRGYAYQLVTHMINEAKLRKHGVILFVKKNNKKASSLYQKLGFKITNEIEIIYC